MTTDDTEAEPEAKPDEQEPQFLRDPPPRPERTYTRTELNAIIKGKLAEQRRKLERVWASERDELVRRVVTETLKQLGCALPQTESNKEKADVDPP